MTPSLWAGSWGRAEETGHTFIDLWYETSRNMYHKYYTTCCWSWTSTCSCIHSCHVITLGRWMGVLENAIFSVQAGTFSSIMYFYEWGEGAKSTTQNNSRLAVSQLYGIFPIRAHSSRHNPCERLCAFASAVFTYDTVHTRSIYESSTRILERLPLSM